MRTIVYTRVSLDREGKSRSVSEQEADCRTWLERRGWTVVDVLCDNDRSASRYATKARPAYRQLVERVRARECDVIAVWESSRLGRTLEDHVELRAASVEAGVIWLIGDRIEDPANVTDRFTGTINKAVDEKASDETSARIRRRTAAAASAGEAHGKLLYGYRLEFDADGGKRRVLDEVTAPIVREVARRVVKGESLYAVAADLNARAVPSPRGAATGWTGSQVRRLCVNPGYAGRRVHKGQVVPGVTALWPRLIPENTYQALLKRLNDPVRKKTNNRAAAHFLSGVLVCGVCDGPMMAGFNGGVVDGVRTRSYLCKSKWCTSRSKEPVEAYVTGAIVGRLMRPDVLDLLATDAAAPAEREQARAALEEAQGRLADYYAAAAEPGGPSPAALAAVEARLLPQIAALEAKVTVPQVPTLVRAVAGPEAARRWRALSVEQQRELAGLLMRPRVLPVGKGRRVFDPASIDLGWLREMP